MREVGWLDLVADLLGSPLTSWPEGRVEHQLTETFAAAGCASYSRSSAGPVHQRLWPPEHFVAHSDEILHWAVHQAPICHPILRYYLGTGDGRSMQVADVPEQFADAHVMAAWVELGRRWGGVQNQVAIPVRYATNELRLFIVGRTEPFTPQEMALSRRLQRLLVGVDRQISQLARRACTTDLDAAGVADTVRLSPRELAVLQLLADGLTAASIGRRLTIAERTVQKHLERSYAKLGVADRLGAVLRAQTIGLLPRA